MLSGKAKFGDKSTILFGISKALRHKKHIKIQSFLFAADFSAAKSSPTVRGGWGGVVETIRIGDALTSVRDDEHPMTRLGFIFDP